jgi:ATP phosphoribosyltransferase regulatory subunit HisZ
VKKYQPPRGIHDYASSEALSLIETEEVLTSIAYSLGFEFVSPSSIDFSYITDFNEISKDRRYEFYDKKGRELSLVTDSALSLMRLSVAKSLASGQYFCKQRIYRYRRRPYRSWTQFTLFYLGLDNDNYILSSIFIIILKVCKLFDLIGAKCTIEFHNSENSNLEGLVYSLSIEEISKLLELEKKQLGRRLKLIELITKNIDSQSSSGFKQSHYTKFTLRTYDKAGQCWMEGGNYDKGISSFTEDRHNFATSVCIGMDLFSKRYALKEKKSTLLILISQEDFHIISEFINVLVDQISLGFDRFSVKCMDKRDQGRSLHNLKIIYSQIVLIDKASLISGHLATFGNKIKESHMSIRPVIDII